MSVRITGAVLVGTAPVGVAAGAPHATSANVALAAAISISLVIGSR